MPPIRSSHYANVYQRTTRLLTTLLAVLLLTCHAQATSAWAAPQTEPDSATTSKPKLETVVRLIKLTWKANPTATAKSVTQLAVQIESSPEDVQKTKSLLESSEHLLNEVLQAPDDPRYAAVSCLTATWGEPRGTQNIQQLLIDEKQSSETRQLVGNILARNQPQILKQQINYQFNEPHVTGSILIELAELAFRSGDSSLIQTVLVALANMPAEIRPTLVERATQRPATRLMLLELVEQQKIAKDLFNTNLLQRLEQSGDSQVTAKLRTIWGTIRMGDHQDRLKAIEAAQRTLRELTGNVDQGWIVYQRVCGQCHVLHERGYEVGPALTTNGRGSFSQLLSNVLDPSLVIGNAYQAYTVLTTDGRVITGLLAEDAPDKLVLKIQGGKLESIPRNEIDEAKVSSKSLMPEGLEAQMTAQELADLFALLTLEKAPGTQPNTLIPETPTSLHAQ